MPVVVAGRTPGAEQRDLFEVATLPSSADFEGTVESLALASDSHIEVALFEKEHRLAASIVTVGPGEARSVHLHGIPVLHGTHEIRIRAHVGAASVRGRLKVEAVGA